MLERSTALIKPTKKGVPRKLRVESPKSKKKDPRESGNTKELKRIQRRDGYYYAHKTYC